MEPRINITRSVKEYLLITFGLFVNAFGWVAVILPAKIVGGGASGLSVLIFHATGGDNGGIPLAYSILGINAVLIAIASFVIGFRFSAKTIYAVVMLSVAMGLLQSVVPAGLLGLSDDKLLSGILGGAMAGMGIGICLLQGGSTGGTDIVAMIVNKYRAVSYGRVIAVCDFIIIGLSYFIGNHISTVIYSYVLVGVSAYTIDIVVAGGRQSSQLLIISAKYDLIASRITENARRGVTLLDGEGWYTKHKTKVVMVLCRKNEINLILRIVKEIDPGAFITVGSVMGVYGKGFDQLRK